MLWAQLSWANKLEFAAFSAIKVCANNANTNHQEVCSISMYHDPNVTIDVSNGEGETTIDHSLPEFGLNLLTKVAVKTFEKVIQIKATTIRDGEVFIGPLSITAPSIDLLNTVQYSGPTVCGNPECNVYYKPFIYISTPWSPEGRTLNF